MTTSARVKGITAQINGWADWELRELIEEVENLRDKKTHHMSPMRTKYRVGGSAS
jgi:hypothetical protein